VCHIDPPPALTLPISAPADIDTAPFPDLACDESRVLSACFRCARCRTPVAHTFFCCRPEVERALQHLRDRLIYSVLWVGVVWPEPVRARVSFVAVGLGRLRRDETGGVGDFGDDLEVEDWDAPPRRGGTRLGQSVHAAAVETSDAYGWDAEARLEVRP